MANRLIDKKLYDAITRFDEDEESREYYYQIMDSATGRKNASGEDETVRQRILKAYGILFCEDVGLEAGAPAGVDEVARTADRLYIGSMGFDPQHWYRMQHHFPVIDDDNYDRFAALVIADLNAGPLRDAAINDGETLVVGEIDPLHMTSEQRKNQKVRSIDNYGGGEQL